MMPCISILVRTLGVMTLVGMASLSLPFPAQAGGVHVSIGVGLPVVVAPAPVIVQPAPVVYGYPAYGYSAYGYPAYRGPYRYWKHHHHHDD